MERDDFSTGESSPQSDSGNNGGNNGNTGFGAPTGSSAGSTARERLSDVGSTVRDRAGNLKDSLANALETGADRLRAGQRTELAGAAAGVGGGLAIENDGRLNAVGTRVAGGMETTADWLRDADIQGLKTGIEHQVREHPGRTLLIAVGLGYLIGKALRS
jgi:hypothetical protein